MFMFSGHPGVTASELMASGCPVVVNEYDDTTWHELYQHEVTCLVTVPTASEIARNLERCLSDTDLRKKLIDGGLKRRTLSTETTKTPKKLPINTSNQMLLPVGSRNSDIPYI